LFSEQRLRSASDTVPQWVQEILGE
jgi:hypothetical protein